MTIAEARDEMVDSHWMASLRAAISAWMELLWGARGSMPLVEEVILTEDYQTGTAGHDCTSNRTICEDLDVRWGMEARA